MRITKNPEDRRQEIIDSARGLFEERGIQNTSITEIAGRIGVAKGLVYYYFDSKERLAEAVIDQLIAGIDDQLSAIVNEGQLDFPSKLSAILNAFLKTIQRNPAILAHRPDQPGITAAIRERLYAIAQKHAGSLLKEATRQGLLTIEYPEHMLQMLVRGLGDLYMAGVHDPQVHTVLIEQTLGLEKGRLLKMSAQSV